MGNLFVIILTLVPFTLGAILGISYLIPKTLQRQSQRIRKYVLIATLTVVAISIISLIISPNYQTDIAFSWLPNAGIMHIHLGQSGLFASLLTTAVALVILILGSPFSRMTASLVLIACGTANLAFISNHFVLRYVALEIVGLCIALIPIMEIKGRSGIGAFRRTYLVLRLGDAGFLVAILLMMRYTGTLDIAVALEQSVALPSPTLTWIVAGLVLAVWVKMGIWPIHNWLATNKALSPIANSWMILTVMPNLGLYLLYRIQPLLVASEEIQLFIGWSGLLAACLPALLAILQTGSPISLNYVHAIQGGLALFWATNGAIHLLPFVVYFSLLRMVLYWFEIVTIRKLGTVLLVFSGILMLSFWSYILVANAPSISRSYVTMSFIAFIIILCGVWVIRSARYHSTTIHTTTTDPLSNMLTQRRPRYGFFPDSISNGMNDEHWLYRLMTQNTSDKLSRGLTSLVLGTGQWLYRVVEQGSLDKIVPFISRIVMGSGNQIYRVIEKASLDGLLKWMSRIVQAISHRLAKIHTGKLRLNLIWVTLCIVVTIVALVFQ